MVALALAAAAWAGVSCGNSAPIARDDSGAGGSGIADADAGVDQSMSGGEGGQQSTPDSGADGVSGIGSACTAGADCQSGHCFDGVCCAQDCSQACHTCALPGSVGTCLVADFGTDPRDDCPDQGVASCGTDGTCDGSGGCRRYATGAVCKPPICSGSTLTLAFRCAAGACASTSGQPCDPYVCGTASNSCPTTCTRDQDCLPPNICNHGSCGRRPLGSACEVDDDCNSMKCQQKVCCSSMCTGTCRSCALPGSEGTCTDVPDREDPFNQCDDAGAASCGTDGSCDGAGACRFYPRGTTCRASAGVCDLAETCAGAGAPCPTDGFALGNLCRASVGVCDLAETCSGAAAACPPDLFVVAGVTCRDPAGDCDVAESCPGNGPACPDDVLVAADVSCRGSAGACDPIEVCDGRTAVCPIDFSAPPPAVPSNVAATRANAQAILTWTAVSGATAYNIKRSTTSGGPYTTVGTTTATTFPNSGLTNGTTYFFVVSATSQAGGCESANSAQVGVIPGPCPGVYCDDFEADVVGTMANGWTLIGDSTGDWSVVADGGKFFEQIGVVGSALRVSFASGAPGAPWRGAISISADVKIMTPPGLGAQAAMVCPRFVDLDNYYCLALGPNGIQIQTRVNGGASNSAIFGQNITNNSIHQVRLSLSAAGVLAVSLDSSTRGTLTPTALNSGFAAVATQGVAAAFDNIVVTQP
ncbi:MAG TPA: hypothetical protein VFH68_07645 [Polyangia bacterium]|nr:hypothetical protein [Polyangia bacterium]